MIRRSGSIPGSWSWPRPTGACGSAEEAAASRTASADSSTVRPVSGSSVRPRLGSSAASLAVSGSSIAAILARGRAPATRLAAGARSVQYQAVYGLIFSVLVYTFPALPKNGVKLTVSLTEIGFGCLAFSAVRIAFRNAAFGLIVTCWVPSLFDLSTV